MALPLLDGADRRVVVFHAVGEVPGDRLRHQALDVCRASDVVERPTHPARGELLLQPDETSHDGEGLRDTDGWIVHRRRGHPLGSVQLPLVLLRQRASRLHEGWVHPCTPTDYGFSCSAEAQVTLQVDGATTSWGQSVYVVGDAKELGGWDPNAAIKLSPTSHPSWTGTVALPRGANVNFKFIKRTAEVCCGRAAAITRSRCSARRRGVRVDLAVIGRRPTS